MRFFFHNWKNHPILTEQNQPSDKKGMTALFQEAEAGGRCFEAILNTISEGILVMDEKLMLQSVNPKAQSIFGIQEPFRGLSLLEATRSTELEAAAYQVLKQNTPIELELKRYTSGEPHCFQVCGTPLKNLERDDAKPEGLVMVLGEVTRLHKLEQIRKDFVANVSHELRTPIQLIKGFAETLLDFSLEDQPRHFIGIILKNAQTMENLITDLLSLVSLEEGGNFPFDMRETLVYPLLQEALASVELAAEKKDIRISLSCPQELRALLYGPFIIQGVINLMDNAIKYSPPGSKVWLKAALHSGDTVPELVITVRDQGMGIPSKHLERIFERFYRVDRARSRAQGGTGLGLAIVRHIALVHQGTAEAESHAGEGSIFKIRIPLIKPWGHKEWGQTYKEWGQT